MNGDGLLFLYILSGGNEQHILVLQGNIAHGTLHDTVNIDRHHLQRTVFTHTVHHGMSREGLFRGTFAVVHQGLDAGDLLAQLVHARTEHCTLHLYHVRIAVDY